MHHAPKYQSVPSTEVYQVPQYMAIYQVAKFNYRTFRTDLPNHKPHVQYIAMVREQLLLTSQQ